MLDRVHLVPAKAPRLIVCDAVLLAGLAVFGLGQDILSYVWGTGQFGPFLLNDARAIGFVEAHGLAGMLALAALASARDRPIFWHALLAIAHALLGACNVVFFAAFVESGATGMAVAVTVVHFVVVALHAAAILRARRGALVAGAR